jgi:hypothetical protein
MSLSAIAPEVNQALDIEAGLTAQIPFNFHCTDDDFTDFLNFHFAQRVRLLLHIDASLSQDPTSGRTTDSKNIGKRNFHSLVAREIYTSNTSHLNTFLPFKND